ncbi:MAG: DMT family transporter [Treponema sp.]|nr:DMT family transporter [Treponema sp.]
MKEESNITKGIFFLISSAFFFALMAVFVKLAGDIHFVQKAFFRNAVAFIIALSGTIRDYKKNGKEAIIIPKGSMLYLFLRAIAGSVGVFGNFYAIDRIVLADATILNKMAPFFTILFCFLFLHEKIRTIPLICIIIAFTGSILIVKPSFNFVQMLPTLAAFMGGVGAGLAYASIRKLSYLKCNGKIIILFFSAFSMLLSVPYMIMSFNPMSLFQTMMLLCAGGCAAGGQFSVTAAYYHAPANKISIYDYSQVIFSAMFGLFFFGQIPDYLSLIGYVIIITMAIINFIYSQHKNKQEMHNHDLLPEEAY